MSSIQSDLGPYAYNYDHHRLIDAQNSAVANEAYTYDKLNNRLSSLATGGTWTYNADNQLLSVDGMSFGYDLNGSVSRKSSSGLDILYRYDVTNQLTSIDDGQGTTLVSYGYDPFGRRLWKEIAGQRTYSFYSNEGLVGEYSETGAELTGYGWAPDATFGTDPLWLKKNGSYYWFENDHRGVPWKLTDSSGLVVWQGAYDSFGKCSVLIDIVTNNLRLPGQYYDAETGLHYNMNRYYDPLLGRYLQLDPAGDGLNGYAYAYGNPMSMTDPHGLCAVRTVAGVAMVVAGIVASVGSCGVLPLLGATLMAVYGAHEAFGGVVGLIDGENFDLIDDGWTKALPNHPRLAAVATFATHILIPLSAGAMIASGTCFVEDTPILTKDGVKPIQDVTPDDMIGSFDIATDEFIWRPVVRLFRRQSQEVLWLTI